jgi:NAD(P)H-dependent flavin oxidoreductase YrpB (nitropropane dioxygenase family)
MLGIEYPILSAGMGPSLIGEKTGAPVDLVVAVSEAGGLGVLGGAGYTVEELRESIREIRKQTDRPFGVDVLLPAATVKAGDAPAESVHEIPLADALNALPPAGHTPPWRRASRRACPSSARAWAVRSSWSRPPTAWA